MRKILSRHQVTICENGAGYAFVALGTHASSTAGTDIYHVIAKLVRLLFAKAVWLEMIIRAMYAAACFAIDRRDGSRLPSVARLARVVVYEGVLAFRALRARIPLSKNRRALSKNEDPGRRPVQRSALDLKKCSAKF